MSDITKKTSLLEKKHLFAFILLSSCFMWWGIANNLTDPLVKVFKEIFGQLSTFQASLIQFAFYFGYFCMALPGAFIARKYSYKTGVLVGLGIYALGCFLLYPSRLIGEFVFFCISFYILACGLGILETNANPFILVLGPKKTATWRLNLAQSFNPIGAVAGNLLCLTLIISQISVDKEGNFLIPEEDIGKTLDIVIYPYLLIAAVLIFVWFLIAFTKMPKMSDSADDIHLFKTFKKLFKKRNYSFAVIAQFFYVGLQITVWTYTIFYIPKHMGVTPKEALYFQTAALILFGLSRWVFTALMKWFKDHTLLLAAAILGGLLVISVIFIGGKVGACSYVGISAFMSLMFPTIFGMGCEGLNNEETKIGSSGLIMAILGGSVITPLQAALIDFLGLEMSFIVPFLCFVVIGAFALFRINNSKKLAQNN